jgi:predicted glycosyltransferase involved in capsule biosynthesis
MCVRLYIKYSVLFLDFDGLNFLDMFSKNTRIQNITKIRQVGAELFYTDGQT